MQPSCPRACYSHNVGVGNMQLHQFALRGPQRSSLFMVGSAWKPQAPPASCYPPQLLDYTAELRPGD